MLTSAILTAWLDVGLVSGVLLGIADILVRL